MAPGGQHRQEQIRVRLRPGTGAQGFVEALRQRFRVVEGDLVSGLVPRPGQLKQESILARCLRK